MIPRIEFNNGDLILRKMDNLEKATQEIKNLINKYGYAELYVHAFSRHPLNTFEQQQLLDTFRKEQRTVEKKYNSHNMPYFKIT